MKSDHEDRRARSLEVLDNLAIRASGSKGIRTEALVVACDSRDILDSTACLDPDWKFWIPPCFREALDIRDTPRVVDGSQRRVATQGPNFAFAEGATIYDSSVAYQEPWGRALQHIEQVLLVGRATAASCVSGFAGSIEVVVMEPNSARSKLTTTRRLSMTQHDFVHLLITGES